MFILESARNTYLCGLYFINSSHAYSHRGICWRLRDVEISFFISNSLWSLSTGKVQPIRYVWNLSHVRTTVGRSNSMLIYLTSVSVNNLTTKQWVGLLIGCTEVSSWSIHLNADGLQRIIISKRLLEHCCHEDPERLEGMVDSLIPSPNVIFLRDLHKWCFILRNICHKGLHEVNYVQEMLKLLDDHGGGILVILWALDGLGIMPSSIKRQT